MSDIKAEAMNNTVLLKNRTDNPLSMIPTGISLKKINKVGIIGFGTMGIGIAIEVLRNMQIPVVVKDSQEGLEKGMLFLKRSLEAMKLPVDDMMNLVTATTEYSDDFKDMDLIIEAVFENYELKQDIFSNISAIVSEDCIIASNTSTIPIAKLSQGVSRPERFIGAHFFSPVPKMELLEIIKGKNTSQDTIYSLIAFAAAIKKRPLVCNDSPGFVVNALLLPYFQIAFQLLQKGVPIEDIDGAMMEFGMPVGPIRLVEEVGIDIPYNSFYSVGLTPPEPVKIMVENNRLGHKKSGQGFFLKDGRVDPQALELIPIEKQSDSLDRNQIQEILFEAFVQKGKELLDLQIISNPGDVDLGTIWGLGFPAGKGGPLKWADLTGVSEKLFGKKFYK
ncbi:3-hydroxyacyl-CoA dehydrogenase family protein [Syntrophomonas curvata]